MVDERGRDDSIRFIVAFEPDGRSGTSRSSIPRPSWKRNLRSGISRQVPPPGRSPSARHRVRDRCVSGATISSGLPPGPHGARWCSSDTPTRSPPGRRALDRVPVLCHAARPLE
jgi:hypothetical protein